MGALLSFGTLRLPCTEVEVMTEEKENQALFRFGIIAPLVCSRFENKAQQRAVRAEILSRAWKFPDGSFRLVAARTLRLWIARYRQNGLDGLYDGLKQARPNKGQTKVLPKPVLDEAIRLRHEVPSRSVSTIRRLLAAQGLAVEGFSDRTLARQLKQHRATKQNVERGDGYFQRWEQYLANDMWQGDTAHGIWLPDPTNPNKIKKTKLIAFVDDATRVCTHAEFYFDEQLPSLVDTFSKALQKRGRPCRLLLDNAFIYHSNTLAGMCANLQIALSFCTPRRPQGKGKVERWIRTVKDSFYPEAARAGLASIDELNKRFHSWLASEYHNKIHSELNCTPIERWQRDVQNVRPVDTAEIRRALMLRARRRVHNNTCCVLLEGEEYQASATFADQMVEVRWHPDSLDNIEIWSDGSFAEIAARVIRHSHVEKKKFDVEQDAEYEPLSSSKNYFATLQGDQLSLFPSIKKNDEFLSLEQFQQLVSECLERSLNESELSRSRSFFSQFAPLQLQITNTALSQAIDAKGTHLHLRFYLQHLEKVVQQNRRVPR
jgi:transposase InsO family protein